VASWNWDNGIQISAFLASSLRIYPFSSAVKQFGLTIVQNSQQETTIFTYTVNRRFHSVANIAQITNAQIAKLKAWLAWSTGASVRHSRADERGITCLGWSRISRGCTEAEHKTIDVDMVVSLYTQVIRKCRTQLSRMSSMPARHWWYPLITYSWTVPLILDCS
jgi:hypothetical protein